MNIIGQPIKHKTFGSGIVTALTAGIVTICFQDSEKKFIYPDAFHHFLVLKDQKTQQCIEKQIQDREDAIQKERQAEQEMQDRKRKSLNFKIMANSHAVFNIASDQLHQIIQTNQISTGTYVSGYSKGQPRIAERMKPNSVCLLTERLAEQTERERTILGACMVREDFFGEDFPDGIIEGHPQHRILLPKENRLCLWEYMGQTAPPRWGNTAFKYCSGDVINSILADMVKALEATEQEKTATDFYRYFCKMNQLRPLIKLEDDRAEEEP